MNGPACKSIRGASWHALSPSYRASHLRLRRQFTVYEQNHVSGNHFAVCRPRKLSPQSI